MPLFMALTTFCLNIWQCFLLVYNLDYLGLDRYFVLPKTSFFKVGITFTPSDVCSNYFCCVTNMFMCYAMHTNCFDYVTFHPGIV